MFKILAAQNREFSIHLLLFFFYFNSYSSAQEEVIYRTANLSTSWLNTGSINYVGVGPNGSWTFLDGTLVWSTNTTGLPATSVLLEQSNMLLVNSSFSASEYNSTGVFWQSYNHPTDTWLDTQELQLGGRLTSSMTASNLSSGMFFLTMTDVGLQSFLDSDPPQLYATLLRCYIGSGFVYTPFGSLDCSSSSIQNSGYAITDYFIKLDPDGRLKYYTMLSNRFTQNEVFEDGCTYATFCGSYGVCTNGLCDCPVGDGNLSYFQQTSPGEPQKGCDPITPFVLPRYPPPHVS